MSVRNPSNNTPLRLQIGPGKVVLDNFTGVDVRPKLAGIRRGHAADLSFSKDGTAQVVFSNALFEHLYLGGQPAALWEWKRVVKDDGLIVCVGVPNFPEIAAAYLESRPGILSEKFDLYHVYRYTHGDPESMVAARWSALVPSRRPNTAPPGWLAQLHKSLFDAQTLYTLAEIVGFDATVVSYAYPGEPYRLCLGLLARPAGAGIPTIEDAFTEVPELGRWVDATSVVTEPNLGNDNSMTQRAIELSHTGRTQVVVSRLRPLARRLKHRLQGLTTRH